MDPTADPRISATAEDALLAKHATIKAGYYNDSFVEAFAQAAEKKTTRQPRHVQPIIKRGTHARVCCMDRTISAFIETTNGNAQVVVLGSGKDTAFFRYKTQALMGYPQGLSSDPKIKWFEVDQVGVIREKANIILSTPSLSQHCPNFQATQAGYQSDNGYHLVAADLRESPDVLLNKLTLDPNLPTLFLVECVFMYLPHVVIQSLLERLATSASRAWIALYEPILGSDPFGQMMERNLARAGVTSPEYCLVQTRTLQDQIDKLVRAGFPRAVGCDMWSAYETVLTPQQRQMANRAEFLDEMEEFLLIMRHYCFVVATTNKQDTMTTLGKDSKLGFQQGKCQIQEE